MLDGGISLVVGQARKRSIEAKHKAALSDLINEFWHEHYKECWFPHVLLKYATKALKEDQSFFPIDKYTLDRDWKERATFLAEYDFLPCGDGNVSKERLLDGSEGYFYAYNGQYFVCLCVGNNYALWRLPAGK